MRDTLKILLIINAILIATLFNCRASTDQEEIFDSSDDSLSSDINIPRIVYPAPETPEDHRFDYEWTLLRAALETTRETHGDFFLEETPHPVRTDQTDALLSSGGNRVHVIRKATSIRQEKRALPVRVPLLKGLLGYRVMITHTDYLPELSEISSIDDLKQYTILQGMFWQDTRILNYNHLQVKEGINYNSFFKQIERKRVPLFSRGVNEAFMEFDEFSTECGCIAVEPTFALHYDMPEYFFVHPDNTALARRIETGLNNIKANGRFDAIFDQFHADILQRAELDKRLILELENPFLPPETPLDQPELWLTLNQ